MLDQNDAHSVYKDFFLSYGTERNFKKNQYLLERGSPATELWYIVKGTVRAFCTSQEGEDITLFYVNENNIIYYESLVSNSVIIQDAQAITSVRVYSLSAEKFLQIVQPSVQTLENLFSHVIDRVVLLHEYILCSHFHESNKRVAYLLYCYYKHSGSVILYTHEQIAAITGINRISVNRILNNFAKDGILSLGYRQIKILSPFKLSEVFDSVGFFSSNQT